MRWCDGGKKTLPGLPAISPTRGEKTCGRPLASNTFISLAVATAIERMDEFVIQQFSPSGVVAERHPRVFSPLVGEMAGRPERDFYQKDTRRAAV